jgi:hypothetical protein
MYTLEVKYNHKEKLSATCAYFKDALLAVLGLEIVRLIEKATN